MMLLNRWQSGTALMLAMALPATTAISLGLASAATATPAADARIAQVFPPSWRRNPSATPTPVPYPGSVQARSVIPAGTVIPTTYDRDRIIVTPQETVPVTLKTATNVQTTSGRVLIPSGSEIVGELRPSGRGTQFVAQELILANSNRRIPISATSSVVTRRETITRRSNPRLLEGAAIGAAAGAILGEIFGSIDWWEVLGGAGLGALASVLIRNRTEVEVIVVEPETDLNLRVESDLILD